VSEAIKKYEKILKKYGIIEIKEIKNFKEYEPKKILEKEKSLILKNIEKNFFTIILDLRGKQVSTEKMANLFNKNFENGINSFQFIIGGAFGIEREVLNQADFVWKLSDLTFNHQIVRIILLEQVYRILSIINGESYHH